MSAIIFLCDMSTEQECLDRRLFGTNEGDSQREHYSGIAVGATLFLYNFETGILRGPYTAETPCTFNLEKDAWKRSRRKFPWQVRVSDIKVYKTPVNTDQLHGILKLSPTSVGLLPVPYLDDAQTAAILAALAKNNSA